MGTLALYGKALLPAIPGAKLLPGVGGGGSDVPDVALTERHEVDREHLAAYSRLCGFRLTGKLPPIYLNVLAFPLHMQVITDPRFPFPAIGLVHVSNRIEQHRLVGAEEPIDLTVTPTKLQPHPKGRTFSLVTEARVEDELVWRGESTMLRRGKGDDTARSEREPDIEITPSAEWRFAGDTGRRYAKVSGDINPIHLYDLTAKPLGFKQAIAHGLYTKARALAAFEGRLPGAFAVDVRFRKPILLPAKVAFGTTITDDGTTHFAVHGVPEPATWPAEVGPPSDPRKGTPHLAGSITPTEGGKR